MYVFVGYDFRRTRKLNLLDSVHTHPHLFGLPSTDELGLTSLEIFGSLIETGVAVPVACLPTLRPLVKDLSLISILDSIRSKLSLVPLLSGQRKELRSSFDIKSKSGSFELQQRTQV